MRFKELKNPRNKSHHEATRRNSRYTRGIFNRWSTFKITMKYGRRKPIRWWQTRLNKIFTNK
jgi:hypothetical protein